MIKVSRYALLLLSAYVLAACEQPATEAPAEAEPAAMEEMDTGPADEKLASVDADGNIAPFGFASKKPVPVAEPTAAAPAEAVDAPMMSAVYSGQCAACHGPDAKGVQGLGLNLVDSELVAGSSVDDLKAFLKAGRGLDSPDNVSGVPMPAFAWMSDEDLGEVTGYLKSLNN